MLEISSVYLAIAVWETRLGPLWQSCRHAVLLGLTVSIVLWLGTCDACTCGGIFVMLPLRAMVSSFVVAGAIFDPTGSVPVPFAQDAEQNFAVGRDISSSF